MQEVHSQLTLEEIGATNDVALVANVWNRLGTKTVGITERISIGYGQFGTMENAIGRAFSIFKQVSTGTVFEGELKVVYEDAQGNTLAPLVLNQTLDILNQGATDMTKRIPCPWSGLIANRERNIVFYIKPLSSATLDVSESSLLMSITRYAL